VPVLHCPACEKAYSVVDPAPGATMPAYQCPACKVPLTAPAAVTATPEELPTLTRAARKKPRREEDEGEPVGVGGWVAFLVLACLLNGAGLVVFMTQDSAPKQTATASLQTALTAALFLIAYCVERMTRKD
jgi:hypothetical protein